MRSKYLTRNLIILVLLVLFVSIVCIVNNHVKAAYPDVDSATYVIDHLVHQSDNVDFHQDDTIVYRDDRTQADLFPEDYYALLINESDQTVLAAKNVHQRMYPASMTKMMTAIVVADAIEAGTISLDDMVEITQNYDLTAEDVAPSQLHRGYTISVKDLLYGLMLESNNYYALYLAEYVGGDIQSFCDRMNQKALELGATNTHFMNPHGLDDPNGAAIDTESTATNLFVTGEVSLPATFHLESWKTGTTDGAGNCLAMYLTKDGKDYVVVASSGNSKADLYNSIIRLLCLTD